MPTPSTRWQRRIAAAEAALDLLDAQDVDPTQQIDVFGLCERLDLWLAFVPLENVLGAFIPEGSGGVLITTQRPLTVQRYTAAHELGHWRMDHGPTADEHDQVFGTNHAEREQLAQIFAGNLLMPPTLVFSILDRVRPSAGVPLTGIHCYAVAREAGVSYEAAIRQLVNLAVLTSSEEAALLNVAPLAIKTELGFGRRPVSGWADVWPIDEQWHDEILGLRVEDEAVISLPENRSSGYRWMLADSPEPTLEPTDPPPRFAEPLAATGLEQAREDFLREIGDTDTRAAPPGPVMRELRRRPVSEDPIHGGPEPQAGIDVVGDHYLTARARTVRPRDAREQRLAVAAGGANTARDSPATVAGRTGRRLIGVRFGVPGAHTVRLVYRSPYAPGSALDAYAIHAMVETRRKGISVAQLATEDEQETWVRAVHEREKSALPPALNSDDPTVAE
jgi:hypothetical protein